MKNDIGFMCFDLKPIEAHNILIKEISKLILNNNEKQICIFNHHSDRAEYDNVPVLPISHAKFFDGDLFLFDIMSLMITQNFPNIKNRYFYTGEIVWLNNNNFYYFWKNLFMHPNLKIIASTEGVKDIYTMCWNKEVNIIKQFSYEELDNVLQ